MTMTFAKMIADSVSPEGVRLSTIEVNYHRFVHSEFMTHRVFSRNSASSRAIPFAKFEEEDVETQGELIGGQLLRFIQDLAWPVEWASEQPGMQGGKELQGEYLKDAHELWTDIRDLIAKRMTEYVTDHPDPTTRLHKSLLNRWIEPGMWHRVIVTGTNWDNYWGLRISPAAMPEIRVAAEVMKQEYDQSTPKPLGYGEWHLPYIQEEDWGHAVDVLGLIPHVDENVEQDAAELLKKVSVARCARVSYLTHDGKRDLLKDVDLYDKLTTAVPMHASPLEHVATPCECPAVETHWVEGDRIENKESVIDHLGNFAGWDQLRHQILGNTL